MVFMAKLTPTQREHPVVCLLTVLTTVFMALLAIGQQLPTTVFMEMEQFTLLVALAHPTQG